MKKKKKNEDHTSSGVEDPEGRVAQPDVPVGRTAENRKRIERIANHLHNAPRNNLRREKNKEMKDKLKRSKKKTQKNKKTTTGDGILLPWWRQANAIGAEERLERREQQAEHERRSE
jgi:hypothetical protein